MTTSTLTRIAPARARTVWAVFTHARQIARERRALARLGTEQLHDIGLSREAAAAEAARRFWDAPEHWRHRR
ncbi:MAG: DUF1127 domain-containing protein [Pseudomonadota bacterium]